MDMELEQLGREYDRLNRFMGVFCMVVMERLYLHSLYIKNLYEYIEKLEKEKGSNEDGTNTE